ncbi:DUF2164 domain-containing protein [Thalassolituus maritimus]|uniref:DUF2164 domain-containing protein n=1 Tax=Thalassolituus maritimus TaxID=484498 RepID=A0ABP9ZYI3_9GAMM
MDKMEFTSEERARMVQKVQMYFREELDEELGSFQAEFLIDFFAEEMGGFFYNRGLYDAETLMTEKLADVSDALLMLEKPVT